MHVKSDQVTRKHFRKSLITDHSSPITFSCLLPPRLRPC